GMTKGSLYYHFASKEDVLNALVTPLMEDLDKFTADATTAGRVDADLLARLVDLLDEHGVLLRSLMGDPSVLHGIARRQTMKQRMLALQRALAGSDDPGELLRGRCALGVINAATIAPRIATADGQGQGRQMRERAVRTRLTRDEKRYVVA